MHAVIVATIGWSNLSVNFGLPNSPVMIHRANMTYSHEATSRGVSGWSMQYPFSLQLCCSPHSQQITSELKSMRFTVLHSPSVWHVLPVTFVYSHNIVAVSQKSSGVRQLSLITVVLIGSPVKSRSRYVVFSIWQAWPRVIFAYLEYSTEWWEDHTKKDTMILRTCTSPSDTSYR